MKKKKKKERNTRAPRRSPHAFLCAQTKGRSGFGDFCLLVAAFAVSSPNSPCCVDILWYKFFLIYPLDLVVLPCLSVCLSVCVGVWAHVCVSGFVLGLCVSFFSLHTACLPARSRSLLCLPPFAVSLSLSLSSSVQAFPALAQVQSLRRVNECLLAENRAMLRVLARLSETASMPETEDLWSSDVIRPSFSPPPATLLLPPPSFSAT